jgi:hypothetical protein
MSRSFSVQFKFILCRRKTAVIVPNYMKKPSMLFNSKQYSAWYNVPEVHTSSRL